MKKITKFYIEDILIEELKKQDLNIEDLFQEQVRKHKAENRRTNGTGIEYVVSKTIMERLENLAEIGVERLENDEELIKILLYAGIIEKKRDEKNNRMGRRYSLFTRNSRVSSKKCRMAFRRYL